MAQVNCETMEGTGEPTVVVYLSPDEVNMIISTWDVPLNFKHMLTDAAKACKELTND